MLCIQGELIPESQFLFLAMLTDCIIGGLPAHYCFSFERRVLTVAASSAVEFDRNALEQ